MIRSARAAAALCVACTLGAAPGFAAAPPTVDTCRLTTRHVVALALAAPVRDGRRLRGNGACQFRAPHGPSATIAERAGNAAYFAAYIKNARDELNVDALPLAHLGERAARWPGNVALVRRGKFALVTILGVNGSAADAAALAIARDVATRL